MSQSSVDVVVVGAGVIGLTTAILLSERGDTVRVIAADGPLETTSAVASAMIGPNMFDPTDPAFDRERRSRQIFTQLARDPHTGVTLCWGRLVSRHAPPDPMTLDGDPIVEVGSAQLPDGFAWGFRTQIPLVDMVSYLRYLIDRLEAAGSRVEIGHFESIEQAAHIAPVVMNCTGVGAQQLAGIDVRPVRGQHVVVSNPGISEFFMAAPFGTSWIGIWPQGNHVVLGSTATEDVTDDQQVRTRQTEQILTQCATVEPRLAYASVLGTQVGLRPHRDEGVYIAVESDQDTVYVHNVGHGGSGVSQSWGSAETAVQLLDDTLKRDSPG